MFFSMAPLMKSLILLLLLVLSACSYRYTQTIVHQSLVDVGLRPEHSYERVARWRFPSDARVAILTLHDPADSTPRLNRALSRALLKETRQHFFAAQALDVRPDFQHYSQYFADYDVLILAQMIGYEQRLNSE